jgi:phytoene dehydrogenase-like protein
VSSRFYDAIVLGRSLGSLALAALLSRRDFRVLLVGQGQRPTTYRFDRRVLARRSFTLLFGASPVWRRILHELAQSPQFRRRARPQDPMFGVLADRVRLELPPDVELFAREIEREFPEVRQVVDELYTTIASVNAAADTAFEKDGVWPPGKLWERFETGQAASLLPFGDGERASELLSKFPSGHLYREIASVPALFAGHLAATGEQLPALALARLHGAWARGIVSLAGGEPELEAFLAERLVAQGGVCAFERRAESLVVRHGSAVGVLLDGDDEPTGATSIITDQWGEALAELSHGQGITRAAERDWPRLAPETGRFVVSALVKRALIPEGLPPESFVLPPGSPRDPRKPVVHLQWFDAAALAEGAPIPPNEALLVAETLLPTRGPLTLLEARAAVVGTLRSALPFFDQHLVLLDSVHDGLPLLDATDGGRREIDRIHLDGAAAGAEPMQRQWTVDPPGYRGLSGEPLRGPIPGTYLCGSSVLPALGQEGELLAAFSVARLVTRRDRTRQRMRQKLWSKIETT